MSNLLSFSTLNEKVKRLYEENSSEPIGNAFMRLALSTIFKLNDDEIEDVITDGPGDKEIDAIHIDGKTVHVLTFKYTEEFNNSLKNYPDSELAVFTSTVKQIISGRLNKKTVNKLLAEKFDLITKLASEHAIDFKIYVVSNKLEPTQQGKIELEQCLEEFNIAEKPVYLDQERIVEKLIDNRTVKINGKISLIDQQHFEKSNGDIKTLIGAIPALDLIDLIRLEDSDEINENIFNENVRVYKPGHRINQAIIASAKKEDNYQFFYLNNGITILCENVIGYIPGRRNPRIELENLQIINGGQTSHSLFEVYKTDKEKLNQVEILVRICKVPKDNRITGIISETSNSQIPVGNRDLHSNDSIQKKLEEQFDALGYYYERKPNQYVDKPKSKVLNNELLGQLYMSYALGKPSEAKNSKALVFNDQYDQIFNEENIDGNLLLNIYNIYLPLLSKKKEVQSKKRKGEDVEADEYFIPWATFHILYAVGLLVRRKEKEINEKAITKAEKKQELGKLSYNIPEFTQIALKEISMILEEQKKKNGDFSHERFFKENSSNILIKAAIEKLR